MNLSAGSPKRIVETVTGTSRRWRTNSSIFLTEAPLEREPSNLLQRLTILRLRKRFNLNPFPWDVGRVQATPEFLYLTVTVNRLTSVIPLGTESTDLLRLPDSFRVLAESPISTLSPTRKRP